MYTYKYIYVYTYIPIRRSAYEYLLHTESRMVDHRNAHHAYVYMYIRIYLYVYVYTYLCIYRSRISIHIYICVCICIYVYIYMYVFIDPCLYLYLYAYILHMHITIRKLCIRVTILVTEIEDFVVTVMALLQVSSHCFKPISKQRVQAVSRHAHCNHISRDVTQI